MAASRLAPLLTVPLGLALTYLADARGWEALLEKEPHELLALPLLATATLLWGLRAWAAPRPLAGLVVLMSFALFCREVHFRGSDEFIWVVMLGAAFWSWKRRAVVLENARDWRSSGWFVAALAGYAFSQMISHRFFRALPDEKRLHVPMEELSESVAHLVFVLAAALGWWETRRPRR